MMQDTHSISDFVHYSLIGIFSLLGNHGVVPRYKGIQPSPFPDYALVTTEFVDGERLHYLVWGKHLQPNEILQIYSTIGRKIGFLAKHRVSFRHLHDENIVIRDEDKEPIIVD